MGYAYFGQRSHSLSGAAGASQPCDAAILVEGKTRASANASSNHGGLTPAAPGWVFDSRCTMLDSRGAAFGSQNHGGLTPAAIVKLAFVHRECRYFPADRRRAPGAAGVSQPCDAGVLVQRKTLAIANASSNHGELTPAALRSVVVSGRTWFGVHCRPVSLPNHGGLTPAALVNMRSSIAKIAFSSADIRTATKERGA
jgi:hypothetical protein